MTQSMQCCIVWTLLTMILILIYTPRKNQLVKIALYVSDLFLPPNSSDLHCKESSSQRKLQSDWKWRIVLVPWYACYSVSRQCTINSKDVQSQDAGEICNTTLQTLEDSEQHWISVAKPYKNHLAVAERVWRYLQLFKRLLSTVLLGESYSCMVTMILHRAVRKIVPQLLVLLSKFTSTSYFVCKDGIYNGFMCYWSWICCFMSCCSWSNLGEALALVKHTKSSTISRENEEQSIPNSSTFDFNVGVISKDRLVLNMLNHIDLKESNSVSSQNWKGCWGFTWNLDHRKENYCEAKTQQNLNLFIHGKHRLLSVFARNEPKNFVHDARCLRRSGGKLQALVLVKVLKCYLSLERLRDDLSWSRWESAS